MKPIKVGDRVECIEHYSRILVGMIGTVRTVGGSPPPFGVEWDDLYTGHNLGRRLPDDCRKGFYVYRDNLKLLPALSPLEQQIRSYCDRELSL